MLLQFGFVGGEAPFDGSCQLHPLHLGINLPRIRFPCHVMPILKGGAMHKYINIKFTTWFLLLSFHLLMTFAILICFLTLPFVIIFTRAQQ